MNGGRKIWLLAINDLRLTVRDRAAFVWMLILPIAFMWLFGQMGGGGGEASQIYLAVEDRDGGWLADALIQELEDDSISLVLLGSLAPEEREEHEDPARVLIIPAGFTTGALAGDQQTLQLASRGNANPQYTIAAQMHVVRVLGRLLGRMAETWDVASQSSEPNDEVEEGTPEEASGEGSFETAGNTALNGTLAEELQRLSTRPPRVRLQVATAGQGQPVPQGMAQSVPGTLTFIVLMMTVIYGGVFLTQEKQQGTLRRQAGLPLTYGQIFAGKLLGRLLLAGLQIVVLVAAGHFLFGVSWGSSPGGLALVLLSYAAAAAGLATLVGAVLETQEQASSVGWLSTLVMAAIGGCFWPSEVMPGWLRAAGHIFPTAWAMDAFHSLISFGRGLEAVVVPSLALLGFAALFTALGSRFLRPG
ncbi:MAG: ABC transporter permease [Acidobacteriota bacterium]|nr:ABC transporter permease [Acidobacteriota bacterium]